jgi:hypothetical protein
VFTIFFLSNFVCFLFFINELGYQHYLLLLVWIYINFDARRHLMFFVIFKRTAKMSLTIWRAPQMSVVTKIYLEVSQCQLLLFFYIANDSHHSAVKNNWSIVFDTAWRRCRCPWGGTVFCGRVGAPFCSESLLKHARSILPTVQPVGEWVTWLRACRASITALT